jgi:hypothetical protein
MWCYYNALLSPHRVFKDFQNVLPSSVFEKQCSWNYLGKKSSLNYSHGHTSMVVSCKFQNKEQEERLLREERKRTLIPPSTDILFQNGFVRAVPNANADLPMAMAVVTTGGDACGGGELAVV